MSKLKSAFHIWRRRGFRGVLRATKHVAKREAALRYQKGPNVYKFDWDVLIILDACRADTIHSVAPSYEFIPEVDTIYSVASRTNRWMQRTFTEEHKAEMAATAYVTGNPNSAHYLDPNDFALLDEVWQYAWDHDHGTVLARPITDRAIQAARKDDYARLIVHYMQPHQPFVPRPDLSSKMYPDVIPDDGENVHEALEMLKQDEIGKSELLAAYRENLEYVLNDVGLLLKNINAQTVIISADHGQAFGEKGVYGHPGNMPISVLREVPWITTSAQDERNYEPDTEQRDVPRNVTKKLQDLGYR